MSDLDINQGWLAWEWFKSSNRLTENKISRSTLLVSAALSAIPTLRFSPISLPWCCMIFTDRLPAPKVDSLAATCAVVRLTTKYKSWSARGLQKKARKFRWGCKQSCLGFFATSVTWFIENGERPEARLLRLASSCAAGDRTSERNRRSAGFSPPNATSNSWVA